MGPLTRRVVPFCVFFLVLALSSFAFAAPSITTLSPTSGAVGASVTITGSGFGSTQGTSTVKFNGKTATVTSWSASSIVATVPSGATTGNVVVTVSGTASAGKSFTVVSAPSITSLSPTSGTVGTSVTITGTNFGSTQGSSTVKFNGTTATPTSWGASSIIVPAPSGATTGNVVVHASGVDSNAKAFTVTVAPTITNLSLNSGAVGASVTITGTNFGSTQSTSTIKFNGTTATATSWSATSIVATVPAGATTGNVVVTVSSVASNGSSFSVVAAPSITSLSPTSGAVGTSVTLTGTNLDTTQGTSTVKFNGTAATPTSWSATSIVVPVPSGATTGNVVVHASGVDSNGKSFTVVSAPNIAGLSTTSGAVGTPVTISGTNFGSTQGTSTVKFNGATATTTSWSATSIVATVPAGATTGNVVVTVSSVASNVSSFTVLPTPNISGLSATSGLAGASVTITGTNFGASQGTNTVTFNGSSATITSWTATSIVSTVPSNATSGYMVVTASGVVSNGVYFTVIAPPTPLLKLRINDSPGFVTLSNPVNTDWIVWGTDGSTPAATRKTNANLISDISPVGGATINADPYSLIQFSWTGGTPIASETNGTPEASVSGAANIGFQITVPASTSVQTLNIYAGVYGSAELDASISDGSSPNIIDTSVISLGEADKTYSIDFRAGSPGQTLTIQLKLTDPNGYLDLQAATLQPHLPEVTLTSPVDGQTFSSGANISTGVGVNQYDNTISSVEISSNGVQLLDMNMPPYSATWSGAAPGHYQLQSTATDSTQLTGTSQPLAIDVVGSGGTLTESLGQFSGTVDLTSEGNADWRMFAPVNQVEDVKAGVPTLISDYTAFGNHPSFYTNPCGGPDSFSFEDGTPDTTESEISPCTYLDGLNNGLQFTVAADTAPRTLRVYLGVDYGVVKMQAS